MCLVKKHMYCDFKSVVLQIYFDTCFSIYVISFIGNFMYFILCIYSEKRSMASPACQRVQSTKSDLHLQNMVVRSHGVGKVILELLGEVAGEALHSLIQSCPGGVTLDLQPRAWDPLRQEAVL